MSELSGIFKRKYGAALRGKGWIREIDPEDARLLIETGLRATDYGRMGGAVRAATASRDGRGLFTRPDGTNRSTDLRSILGPAYDIERAGAPLHDGYFPPAVRTDDKHGLV